MKKIIHIITLAAAVSFASCEMDQMPSSGIDQKQAFTDLETIKAMEVGAYAYLQTAYNLYSMIVPDIQSDYMHATNSFSNTYGSMYMWDYIQEATEVKATWDTCYKAIGQFNFVLDGLEDNAKLEFSPTIAEQVELNLIRGRLYLMRAMLYEMLTERFCADYDATTASIEYTGVPQIKAYDPGEMPSRASLHTIYEQILEDLDNAKKLLASQRGSANSTTLNIDCVTALEARVYLQMDNYQLAYKRAQSLIGNSAYSLVDSQQEFQDMWTYDRSSEIIFVFYASKTELPTSFGEVFGYDLSSGMDDMLSTMVADYIPTKTCLMQYESTDWRRAVYFLNCSLTVPVGNRRYAPMLKNGNYAKELVMLRKYPGNPDLRTSAAWSTRNAFKPLRLAEMYLIAAEAAIQSPATTGDAATPLNELRKHRNLSDLPEPVTMADVQAERYREMIAEGTRLTDLKRWKLDMARGEEQTSLVTDDPNKGSFEVGTCINPLGAHTAVEWGSLNAYRFLWPLPASEVFANRKLESQQNPGWNR